MGLSGIGFQELFVIFLLVLLLFGAKRLPEVGRNLGRGIREFKKATKEISSDVDLEEYEKKPPRKPAESREEPEQEETGKESKKE